MNDHKHCMFCGGEIDASSEIDICGKRDCREEADTIAHGA